MCVYVVKESNIIWCFYESLRVRTADQLTGLAEHL